jgi:hypothetical protein
MLLQSSNISIRDNKEMKRKIEEDSEMFKDTTFSIGDKVQIVNLENVLYNDKRGIIV